jgi:RRXRR protein
MKVFVLSQDNKPLMPTTPRRARLWLKAKQALVVSREPFTVQLRFETTNYTQPATVGVDTGSRKVAIAAIANRQVVFAAITRGIRAVVVSRRSGLIERLKVGSFMNWWKRKDRLATSAAGVSQDPLRSKM